MSEYIDKSEALKRFCGHCEDYEACTEQCYDWKLINYTPAADVAPVRHGYWVEAGLTRMYGFKCSECSGFCIGESRYCPNCGARMDGAKGGSK